MARTFYEQKARELAGHTAPQSGPYTLEAALRDYFEARERRGSKGARADRYASEARIVPTLGMIDLAKLTTKRIRDWHSDLAVAPKLV